MSKKSACHENSGSGPDRAWSISAVLAAAIAGFCPTAGNAYTAAGDRNFPANLILPQVAPTDAFWGTVSTQPMANGPGGQVQFTQLAGTYSKTITERFGIQLGDGVTRRGQFWGTSNFDLLLQYEAINSQPHEFVLSVQVDHEFGETGSARVGSSPQSATQPGMTFAKGLGDLPIGYWRPVAMTGLTQFQIAQGSPPSGQRARADRFRTGFSIQYSIPYLVSKVENVNLPPLLRGVTPMIEVLYDTPVGSRHNHDMMLQVAPGFNYSQGRGWELGVEALIPATRTTGTGLGFIVRLVVQLDYLLPDSFFGRPVFPLHELR
jgi:hypothetical protein